MKSCRDCGKLIPYGRARCPDCEARYQAQVSARSAETKRQRDRKYNHKRDPKYSRFYNSRDWRSLSALVMRERGYQCEHCGKRLGQRLDDGRNIILEVDHIDPIQTETGWIKRLDRDNLQVLCIDCHNEKHHRFQRRKPTPRGW